MMAVFLTLWVLVCPADASEVPPEPRATESARIPRVEREVAVTVAAPPLPKLDVSRWKAARGLHTAAGGGLAIVVGGATLTTAGVLLLGANGGPVLESASLRIGAVGLVVTTAGQVVYTLSSLGAVVQLRRAGVALPHLPALVAVGATGLSATMILGMLMTRETSFELALSAVVVFHLSLVATSIQYGANSRELGRHRLAVAPLVDQHTRGVVVAMRF
ncbi:MAG: hypothetical protein KTR31_18855 [Myxococcales bacterium]|nr:hypothetical protein [Myxococcales bacterium]